MAQESSHYGSPDAKKLEIHIGGTLSDAKSELQVCFGIMDIINRVLDVFLGSTFQDLFHLLAHKDLKLLQINEYVPGEKAFAFTFASPNYYNVGFLGSNREIGKSVV